MAGQDVRRPHEQIRGARVEVSATVHEPREDAAAADYRDGDEWSYASDAVKRQRA
jgi:hypothetical protein